MAVGELGQYSRVGWALLDMMKEVPHPDGNYQPPIDRAAQAAQTAFARSAQVYLVNTVIAQEGSQMNHVFGMLAPTEIILMGQAQASQQDSAEEVEEDATA